MSLASGVAVVVGGASGIGAGICHALAAAGADLAICDIDTEGAEVVKGELDHRAESVTAHYLDVCDARSMSAAQESIRALHGRIDLLFVNAGSLCLKPFLEASAEDWEWLFRVNLLGCTATIRAFLPGLLAQDGSSRIVITSSVTALRTPKAMGMSLYMATKSAQFGLFRALKAELEDTGVELSIIFPGPVASALREKAELARPGSVMVGVSADATSSGYLSAQEAGVRIVAAIERGEGYIVTHPEEIELIAAEQAEMLAAMRRSAMHQHQPDHGDL